MKNWIVRITNLADAVTIFRLVGEIDGWTYYGCLRLLQENVYPAGTILLMVSTELPTPLHEVCQQLDPEFDKASVHVIQNFYRHKEIASNGEEVSVIKYGERMFMKGIGYYEHMIKVLSYVHKLFYGPKESA